MNKYSIKLCFLLVFFILFSNNNLITQKDDTYLQYLKEKVDITNNEKLVVAFFRPETCLGCNTKLLNAAICFNRELNKKSFNCKILALVMCGRKIELKYFQKKYNWEHYMLVDKGISKMKLKLPKETIIAIYDATDDKPLIITETTKDICKKILNHLK